MSTQGLLGRLLALFHQLTNEPNTMTRMSDTPTRNDPLLLQILFRFQGLCVPLCVSEFNNRTKNGPTDYDGVLTKQFEQQHAERRTHSVQRDFNFWSTGGTCANGCNRMLAGWLSGRRSEKQGSCIVQSWPSLVPFHPLSHSTTTSNTSS